MVASCKRIPLESQSGFFSLKPCFRRKELYSGRVVFSPNICPPGDVSSLLVKHEAHDDHELEKDQV